MKRLCVWAVGVSCLHASAFGGVLYLSQDSNINGLYSINTSTGVAVLIGSGSSAVTSETVGLALGDSPGVLFGSAFAGMLRINKDGSGAVLTGSAAVEGLEYAGGILYGAFNGSFFTINQASGNLQTTLAAPGVDIEGLAFGNGVIYGLQGEGVGGLYSYNIGLNNWSLIGPTGVLFDQAGLAYDTELNLLYAVGDQDSNLYRIDPATGVATVIGSTGLADPGGGLAFEATVPEPHTFGLLALGIGFLGVRRYVSRIGQ